MRVRGDSQNRGTPVVAQLIVIVKPAQTRLRIAIKVTLGVMMLGALVGAYIYAWDYDPHPNSAPACRRNVVTCGMVPQAPTGRASEDPSVKGNGLASRHGGSRLASGR